MSDMGEAGEFLGMKITRDRKQGILTFDQRGYIQQVINRFSDEDRYPALKLIGGGVAKGKTTPMSPDGRDSNGDYRLTDLGPNDKVLDCPYRELLGCLLYMSVTTRPDIAFSVGNLARFGEKHGMSHWIALVRVLKYLKHTITHGLVFKRRVERGILNQELVGYCDSDYAGCPNTRKSVTGRCIFFGGNLVSWVSKKQSSVALSSTDAEYIACTDAVTNIINLRRQVQHIGVKVDKPTELNMDNQSAIVMVGRTRFEKRLKHIDVRFHFVKQEVGRSVELKYVESQWNLADLLTKALPLKDHTRLRDGLNVVCTTDVIAKSTDTEAGAKGIDTDANMVPLEL